jgi:hypothetical protein
MPAIVGKAAQLPVIASDEDNRPARTVKRAIITGLGQLLRPGQEEPVLQEQLLAFRLENRRIGVEPRRHRPRLVQRTDGGGNFGTVKAHGGSPGGGARVPLHVSADKTIRPIARANRVARR